MPQSTASCYMFMLHPSQTVGPCGVGLVFHGLAVAVVVAMTPHPPAVVLLEAFVGPQSTIPMMPLAALYQRLISSRKMSPSPWILLLIWT